MFRLATRRLSSITTHQGRLLLSLQTPKNTKIVQNSLIRSSTAASQVSLFNSQQMTLLTRNISTTPVTYKKKAKKAKNSTGKKGGAGAGKVVTSMANMNTFDQDEDGAVDTAPLSAEKKYTPEALKTNLMSALDQEEMDRILAKRGQQIPTFFAGSVLKVRYHDSSDGIHPREFVGLCIAKINRGIGSSFVLKNSFHGTSVEGRFHTYSPLIVSIQVLELARMRRAKLYYLRDKPNKHSTVSQRFEPVPIKAGAKIPVKKFRG